MKETYKKQLILNLIEAGNGYVKTADVESLGISKTYFRQICKKENLEKVAQGVYRSQDAWEDPLYEIQLTYPAVIFSHETALYLNGLMEHEPSSIHVTVYTGYNATSLREKGCRVHSVDKACLRRNIITIEDNYCNRLFTYDCERTICEIVKVRSKTDVQVFQYAMKTYMKRRNKNINALINCARDYGMEDEIRKYTEVML